MKNAFDVVRDFEQAVCEYTGAPYCVAVNSCTNALGLCFEYLKDMQTDDLVFGEDAPILAMPKYTYVGVPIQAKRLGFEIQFADCEWQQGGWYQIYSPADRIIDSARLFTSNMYNRMPEHSLVCTSHHWSKHLSTEQGGCILHDNEYLNGWLRKMRFDGRTEGVAVKDDKIDVLGWHCYMSPSSAALGLTNLMHLPKHNKPLPEANYPDLSQMEIFK